MSTSLVDVNDKILIHMMSLNVTNSLVIRFMIGEVGRTGDQGMRITGYSFYCDLSSGKFYRRKTPMTILFSFNDTRFMYMVMPQNINIDEISFSMEKEPILKLGNQYKIPLKDLLTLSQRIESK